MGSVVSLGSINVDRIHHVSPAEIARLREQHAWFPERGQTVEVEALPDGFPPAPDGVRHGGKGANKAVAAAAAGAATTMLGKVGPGDTGSDTAAGDPIAALEAAGVAVDAIETATAPTGTADVFVGPDGDNRIVVRPGANQQVDREYVESHSETLLAADCLLVQNEIPTATVADVLAELAGDPDRPTVVLDPAPAAGASELLTAAAVDYVTPNEPEYEALEGDLDACPGVVIRTRGERPVVVETDPPATVQPPAVEAVDTTGAGDVFGGVLAARLADAAPLKAAVETAVTAASLAIQEPGARGGIPTLDELQAAQRDADRP